MEIAKLIAVFEGETSNFEAANKRVESGIEKTSQTYIDANGRMRDASGRFASSAEKDMGRAGNAFTVFSSHVGNIGDKFKSLGGSMQSFGATLSASISLPLTALGALSVKTSASFDSLKRGLTAVAGSSSEAERQLSRLKEVAKLPGLGFKEAIQGAINLQAAGFNAELAERALKGFGNALATVGKGKAELDGVITALSQIASKGKISAEEINQLAERVPQIRQIMKSAFGTSDTEALQNMGISAEAFVGKVTAELEKLPQVTGGIGNAFENLSDLVEQALLPVGDAINSFLIPAIETVSPYIQQLSDYFKSLSPTMQGVVLAIGAIATAAGPVIALLGTAGIAVGGLATLFGTLGTAIPIIAAAFATFAPVIAVVGAHLAALYLAWTRDFGGIKTTTLEVWEVVKSATTTAINAIYDLTQRIGGDIVRWWNDNYPLIEQTVKNVSEGMRQAIQTVGTWIADFWARHGDTIVQVIKNAWDSVSFIVSNAVKGILAVIKITLQAINGDWAGAWETVKDTTRRAFSQLEVMFRAIGNALLDAFARMIVGAVDFGKSLFNAIDSAIRQVIVAFANLPQNLISLVPKFIAAGLSIGAALVNGIKDGLSGVATATASVGGTLPQNNTSLINGATQAKAQAEALAKAATIIVAPPPTSPTGTGGGGKVSKTKKEDTGDKWDWRAIKAFGEAMGFNVGKTASKNGATFGGKHNPGSAHYAGLAVDFSVKGKTSQQIAEFFQKALESGLRVLDERKGPMTPGAVWKGAHLHLEASKKRSFLPNNPELEVLDRARLESNSKVASVLKDQFQDLSQKGDTFRDVIKSLSGELQSFGVNTREGQIALELMGEKFQDLTEAQKAEVIELAKRVDWQNKQKESLASFENVLKDLGLVKEPTIFERIDTFFSDITLTQKIKGMADAVSLTVERFKEMLKWNESIKGLTPDSLNIPIEPERDLRETAGAAEAVPLLNTIGDIAPRITKPWEDFFKTLRDGFGSIRESMPPLRESLGEALLDIPSRMADVWTNAIQNTDGTIKGFFKSLLTGFAQMVNQILMELARIAIMKAVTSLFSAALGGGFGSAGPAAPGVGLMAGARAAGGPVSSNLPYLVGEKGWEVFVPKTNGQILNQDQLGKLGGQKVEIHNHFHPDPKTGRYSQESAEQAGRRMGGQIQRSLVRG
jgi:tape measure domain-containing protein